MTKLLIFRLIILQWCVVLVCRPAISVKTGEYIFSTKSCPRGLCPERVVQLSLSVKQGKVALTRNRNIQTVME